MEPGSLGGVGLQRARLKSEVTRVMRPAAAASSSAAGGPGGGRGGSNWLRSWVSWGGPSPRKGIPASCSCFDITTGLGAFITWFPLACDTSRSRDASAIPYCLYAPNLRHSCLHEAVVWVFNADHQGVVRD